MSTITSSKITNNQQKINPVITWGLLALLALIWGSSFILVKESLKVFEVSQVGAIRIFAAFLFFIPIFIYHFRTIPHQKWGFFLLVGCLGNLFPAFLFSLAGSKLDSAVSGALNSTTPLFALIVAALFFGKKITKNQSMGIVLGFLGALTLVLATVKDFAHIQINAYALVVVLATVMYGFNLNITQKYLGGINPLVLTASIFMSIGPIAGIVLFQGDFIQRVQRPDALMPLIYSLLLGIMGSAMAMILFNKLLQMTNAILASSVTYLIPIVAIAWGILSGEQIGVIHFTGMAIILVGVYLVNKNPTKE
jgi:drug/metabolite transporter (DMT)-like permease